MKPTSLYTAIVVLSLLAVGSQPALGTKFIPADESIGTWDEDNGIYTLTTDVEDYTDIGIQIDQDNLILDGAGHTLPDPMAELQGYDAMLQADQINQAIDQVMDQPGLPEPGPWQMQNDPFAAAQQMFDEQMQFMANPFMMPSMGPMGPMPGPAPM